VLFINADREYKEGKNQNKLRPEDIEKITYTYRNKKETLKYSKLVAKNNVIDALNSLEKEEFNFNIRRFVDNAPPPEPQDVHAHLQGGIPESEVNALQNLFACYNGLRDRLFIPLKANYLQFADGITHKEEIKKLFDESDEIKTANGKYTDAIKEWWALQIPVIELLPEKKINVFDLYHQFSATLTAKLDALPILNEFKCRGTYASFWYDKEINSSKVAISTDFKSVDASGWNAELIPDDEILESQFPEVLKELKENEARRDELQAKFDEVNELEDDVWNEEDYEVWRSKELKEHKEVYPKTVFLH
jgi:type I restriction enzyme M protein